MLLSAAALALAALSVAVVNAGDNDLSTEQKKKVKYQVGLHRWISAKAIKQMRQMDGPAIHAEMSKQMNTRIDGDETLNAEEKAQAKLGQKGVMITGERHWTAAGEMKRIWLNQFRPCFQQQQRSGWAEDDYIEDARKEFWFRLQKKKSKEAGIAPPASKDDCPSSYTPPDTWALYCRFRHDTELGDASGRSGARGDAEANFRE